MQLNSKCMKHDYKSMHIGDYGMFYLFYFINTLDICNI
jgi:hypothetical protein